MGLVRTISFPVMAAFICGMTACSAGVWQNLLDPDAGTAPVLDFGVEQKEPELDVANLPPSLISVHSVVKYASADKNEVEITSFAGRMLRIDKIPWITSKEIKDIEAIERPDQPDVFDLKLTLTAEGCKQWNRIIARDDERTDGFALVIDGEMYRLFHPRRISKGADTVFLDGPFGHAIAFALENRAPLNYAELNGIQPEKAE